MLCPSLCLAPVCAVTPFSACHGHYVGVVGKKMEVVIVRLEALNMGLHLLGWQHEAEGYVL